VPRIGRFDARPVQNGGGVGEADVHRLANARHHLAPGEYGAARYELHQSMEL
jgi:hypothetical protein